VKQNRCKGQTSDEAMLVQRAVSHDAETFGGLDGMHVDRLYGHIEIA